MRNREAKPAVSLRGARREHRLENTRQVRRGDARARIRHQHVHALIPFASTDTDQPFAVEVDERLLGIHQQIRDGLMQLSHIAGNGRKIRRCGQLDHDAERVRLYIEESFTFLVLSPQAAVPLAPGDGNKA